MCCACLLLCHATHPRAPPASPRADGIRLWWCRLLIVEPGHCCPRSCDCGIHRAQLRLILSRTKAIGVWVNIYNTAVVDVDGRDNSGGKDNMKRARYQVPGTSLYVRLFPRPDYQVQCSSATNSANNMIVPWGRKRKYMGGARTHAACLAPATRIAVVYLSQLCVRKQYKKFGSW